ncbi:hypothetical protein GCM10028775_40560 [Catellatospora paridis]
MTDRRLSWSSTFWNIVLAGVFLVMAVLFIERGVFYLSLPGALWAGVGFGAFGVAMAIGALRAPFVGVRADGRGITIRAVTSTKRIPWQDVSRISLGGLTPGASGAAGATAPVVFVKSGGATERQIVLKELGGYGVSSGRSVAQQAAEDLNRLLTEWRKQHKTSS